MIGVVPAAGYATRMGRMDSSKEMLEIDGVPVVERLVRRMEVGGCTEIRIVTRPEKGDVRRYAERRNLALVLGHPEHIGQSVALGLAQSDPDQLVALGFPDSLWEPLDGFTSLRFGIDSESDVVLGLFDFDDPRRADVVMLDENDRVRDILVKPAEPPSRLIWGCLVARGAALQGIEASAWPSDHLRPSIAAGRVAGRYLSDTYMDIGTPGALALARESPATRSP